VPGDSVDGQCPPPPALLSPPHYRHPMDLQQSYGDATHGHAEEFSKGGFEEYGSGTGTIKRSNRESPSASSLRKYAIQNNTTTAGPGNGVSNSMPKAESSLSINSVDRLCSMSDTLSKEGGNSSSAAAKRTSVVFEEPKGSSSGSRGGNSSYILSHNRQVSTSKAVNGILRKGSLRGEDDDDESGKAVASASGRGSEPPGLPPPASRKARKPADSRHGGSSRHAGSSSKHRKAEAAEETGDSSDKRSSRSRSNSTKSSKGGGDKNSKDAGSLALTRDLPWCGCWGNGCL
jgi:hypothetical protein